MRHLDETAFKHEDTGHANAAHSTPTDVLDGVGGRADPADLGRGALRESDPASNPCDEYWHSRRRLSPVRIALSGDIEGQRHHAPTARFEWRRREPATTQRGFGLGGFRPGWDWRPCTRPGHFA